jgi:hypothetical protein
MSIPDFSAHHPAAHPMLDDLDVSQRAGDTIAHYREAPPAALPSGTVGLPDNLWEQRRVAGIPIRQQHQLVVVG